MTPKSKWLQVLSDAPMDNEEFHKTRDVLSRFADFLIDSNAIVLSCTPGDTLYSIQFGCLEMLTVISISLFEDALYFTCEDEYGTTRSFECDDLGRTLFLCRADAIKKLKERGSND